MTDETTSKPFILDRDSILGMQDIELVPYTIPEWNGGIVYLKPLSGAQRDRFEQSLVKMTDNGKKQLTAQNFRARLCVMCICDENGKRIFADSDADALGRKNAAVLSRLYDKISEMSGISEKDEKELLGNSNGATGDDSFSA